MPNAIVFLFVLSVLVVVHEFGHFIVAKLAGIRVERFSIGFGPVIFGKKIAGTEFVFSLLPLGGFVKMAGENPNEAEGKEWEFNSKPLGWKFLVVFAGPLMNALLAVVLFTAVFFHGQPMITATIGKVMDATPAKAAGFLEGDRVRSVNGHTVVYWEDVLQEVHKGQDTLLFLVERDKKLREISVVPKREETRGFLGRKHRISFIGIAPSNDIVRIKHSFPRAVVLGVRRVLEMTGLIFYSFGLMFSGAMSFKDSVTGPIGIYFMTGQAAQLGLAYLLYFMGSLSVSLFVLNLLPVPVLDGGHVLFILIEKLKGSPLKESVKERMTQGGMAVLLGLMAFVIFQDLHRFSIVENVIHMAKRVF